MKFRTILFLGGLLAAATAPLSATTVAVDGAYHEFQFGAAGTFAYSCGGLCTPTTLLAEQTGSPAYTFTGSGTVNLVDLFIEGDQFELFDNSLLVGSTSTPLNTGANPCGGDITCAMTTTGYSKGSFLLGAGSHSLTIEVIQNATGSSGGAAVFNVAASTSPVPEPASLMLTGTGLSGLALVSSRVRALASKRRKMAA